ncbi:hypothetical protein L9F63_021815, partial [Diploptera punctata]
NHQSQKKKKAPPPPPVNKTTSLERHLSGKSSTTQPPDKSSKTSPEIISAITKAPPDPSHSPPVKTISSPPETYQNHLQKLLMQKQHPFCIKTSSYETASSISKLPDVVSETAAMVSEPHVETVPVPPVLSEEKPEVVPAPVEFASVPENRMVPENSRFGDSQSRKKIVPEDKQMVPENSRFAGLATLRTERKFHQMIERCYQMPAQKIASRYHSNTNRDGRTQNTLVKRFSGYYEQVVDQAFSCVTAELDDDVLPPAEEDWQYQLPAPPSAFRDTSSPTFTDTETANAQVFTEPDRSVTRVNPLFVAQDYDEYNESKYSDYQHDTATSSVKSDQSYASEPQVVNNEPQQSNESEARSSELSNFTITTYQRPRVNDEIFNEETNNFKKPAKLFLHQKFNSTTTLNSDANTTVMKKATSHISLQNNDDSDTNMAGMKKATSYISLQNNNDSDANTKGIKKATSQVCLQINDDESDANMTGMKKATSQVCLQNNNDGNMKRATSQTTEVKDEERQRLIQLQEQFLQLQQQLLQNSSLLEKQNSTADAPLQSLQVLRSILPQLGQQPVRTNAEEDTLQVVDSSERQNSKSSEVEEIPQYKHSSNTLENSEMKQMTEPEKQTSIVTVNTDKPPEPKRYVYRGPPAVNFTTWSERPKSQVSIKMDGDYRIGVGQSHLNKSVPTNPAKSVPTNSAKSVPTTTANSVPTVNVSDTKEPGRSAPSRVPIVRSVELKKSFVEQQNLYKSQQNGDGSTEDQRSDDSKFVGVNSLAKKFSNGTRPVSAYGRVENTAPRKFTSVVGIGADAPSVVRVNGFAGSKQLMPVVKGFQFATPGANRDTTDSRIQKNDSVSLGNIIQRSDSISKSRNNVQVTNSISGNIIQRTDSMTKSRNNVQLANSTSSGNRLEPAVRFQQTSLTSETVRDTAAAGIRTGNKMDSVMRIHQSEPPKPPPLKKSIVRPKTLPIANPRDQLMDAIRNFGGREKLRHSPSQDNVVVIR